MCHPTPWQAQSQDMQREPDRFRPYFLGNSYNAYTFALKVEGPHKETRKVSLQDPRDAINYARFVDKKPCKETWLAVIGHYHVIYAKHFVEELGEEAFFRAIKEKAL